MLCCPVRVVPVSCFPCSNSRVPNSLITGQVGTSQPCPGRLHSHLFFPFSLQLSPPLLASAPLLPSCLSSPALFCASRQACLDPSCRRLRRFTFVRYYFDSSSLVPCHFSVKHAFLFNFFFLNFYFRSPQRIIRSTFYFPFFLLLSGCFESYMSHKRI